MKSRIPLVALAAMVTFLPGCAYLSRASESTTGVQADASSGAPSLSSDGRWIAFHSTATNLVAGDTNGVRDVFVRDNTTKKIVRISVKDDGTQSNRLSQLASISDDGRRVVFESDSDEPQRR